MPNEILSYIEMCQREGVNLQRGMNFRLKGGHSVILMSVMPNAPYKDHIQDDGTTLIYEGHDEQRGPTVTDPKLLDQPEATLLGTPAQNGRFHRAAQCYKQGDQPPEKVRVYEKLRPGIWSYNGIFHLVDSWQQQEGSRKVFKFKLIAVESAEDSATPSAAVQLQRRRIIPTEVKLEVWKRDDGKCAMCGAKDELHFDHILPYSRGGTSVKAENVQLLCARHNLAKSDKII